MARGNSKAQSEVGTLTRGNTVQSRINRANERLASGMGAFTNDQDANIREMLAASSEAQAILAGNRPSKEEYDIGLIGSKDPAGKLNMMDGTINGKEISRETRGAFSNTTTTRRGSRESERDFEYEKGKLNRQEGFIFAKDEKNDVFAIPHNWDVNDPQGTVGVFKGDTLTIPSERTGDRVLTVIGTFDNSKRGLNLAAAACGDSIGRSMGVKQTATILTDVGKKDAERMTDQSRELSRYSYQQLPVGLVEMLNKGQEAGGLRHNFSISRRNG